MQHRYIHIGYPKNFSTSLQRDYFSKHPDLYHLGIGLQNNLGYKDTFTEQIFEVYLKTCKAYKYAEKEKAIQAHFTSIFKSIPKKYKAVGVSAEHLSFAFSYDGLSAKEKAERLHRIFGADTKIVMLVRNQADLIKSLYRECVRVGFLGDFTAFIKLCYKYQDRNFIYDFRYDLVYNTYASLFGEKNIGVFFFENYRANDGTLQEEEDGIKLFKDLNKFLEVSNHPMSLGHYNEAIPSNKVLIKASINEDETHDLSNHLLESAEKHRIKTYLEEELSFYEEESKTYSDVLKKRKQIAATMASKKTKELSYSADPQYLEFFKHFYESGNLKFENSLGFSLPKKFKDLSF